MRRPVGSLLGSVGESLPAVGLALIPAGVTYAVASRYLFGRPVRILNETVILVTIWVVYLGLATATRQGLHPGFDLIPRPKDPAVGRLMDRVRDGAMVLITLTLAYYGLRFAIGTRLTFLTLGVSKRWAWFALPVGAAFTSTYLLFRMWRPSPPQRRDGEREHEGIATS